MQLTWCMILLHSSLIELYNRSKKLGCCPSGTWDIISLNLQLIEVKRTVSSEMIRKLIISAESVRIGIWNFVSFIEANR